MTASMEVSRRGLGGGVIWGLGSRTGPGLQPLQGLL
jgi:hypothetical protein